LAQPSEIIGAAIAAIKQAQEPVESRSLKLAKQQWEHWKQYALELQERLVKYEGGAPMVLNAAEPAPKQAEQAQEPVGYTDNTGRAFAVKWSGVLPPNITLYAAPKQAEPEA